MIRHVRKLFYSSSCMCWYWHEQGRLPDIKWCTHTCDSDRVWFTSFAAVSSLVSRSDNFLLTLRVLYTDTMRTKMHNTLIKHRLMILTSLGSNLLYMYIYTALHDLLIITEHHYVHEGCDTCVMRDVTHVSWGMRHTCHEGCETCVMTFVTFVTLTTLIIMYSWLFYFLFSWWQTTTQMSREWGFNSWQETRQPLSRPIMTSQDIHVTHFFFWPVPHSLSPFEGKIKPVHLLRTWL